MYRIRGLGSLLALIITCAPSSALAWGIYGCNGDICYYIEGPDTVAKGQQAEVATYIEDYTPNGRGRSVRYYLIGTNPEQEEVVPLDYYTGGKYTFTAPNVTPIRFGIQTRDASGQVFSGATSPNIRVTGVTGRGPSGGSGTSSCYPSYNQCDRACSGECVRKIGCAGDSTPANDHVCQ